MTFQNDVLANMVRERFQEDSRLSAQCLDVEVSERDIILIGCVESEELKQTAEETARGVPGVRHVENQIVVHIPSKQEAA